MLGGNPLLEKEVFTRGDVARILNGLCETNIRLGFHKELGMGAAAYRRSVHDAIMPTVPDVLQPECGNYFDFAVLMDVRIPIEAQIRLGVFDSELGWVNKAVDRADPSKFYKDPALFWATNGYRFVGLSEEEFKLVIKRSERGHGPAECVALLTHYPEIGQSHYYICAKETETRDCKMAEDNNNPLSFRDRVICRYFESERSRTAIPTRLK